MLRLASVVEDQGVSGNGHRNSTTSYLYDPAGHMLSQTDPLSHAITYTIDNLGRTTKVTDASNNVEQTYFSLAGEVIGIYNARGQKNTNAACSQSNETVCNTLDRVGRLTGVSYLKADGTTQLSRSFGYDADGNQTSFSDSDVAQTTVSYDHLNRPSTVTASSPYGTTSYTYFIDGATNTTVDANGTTTFSEDRLGRTATMIDPLTGGTVCNTPSGGTTCYTYDAAGRLTGRTEANGIVTSVADSPIDQLTSKTEVAGSTTLASWTNVTYDLAGNRTAETLAYYASNPYPDAQAGTSTYQYDTENQINQFSLPGKTAASDLYDLAHNLTSNAGVSQSYNANESLAGACSVTFTPDKDGNLNQDCNSKALGWNSLSQLETSAVGDTYAYDALGRLTTVTNGSNVTKFVYQGLSGHVIQELNSSNAVIRSYAWDTLGRQLYVKSGANAYYQITNPHGDNVAWASATALVGTQHFDPWGNLTYTPSGTTIPFGFQGAAGSWTNSATGFVSMGVRWYYPKVSEFLSSDPAAGTADPRTPIARTRWLYGADDPLTNSDPTGLLFVNPQADNCDAACMQQVHAVEAQQAADAAEARQQTMAEGSAIASSRAAAASHPSCVNAGRAGCIAQYTGSCTIGSQDCGTFFSHAGQAFLGDLCGITICPAIRDAQATYELISDPSSYWNDQVKQWNSEMAWLEDIGNTYNQAANAHLGSVPIGLIPGVPEALFGMKWTADRIGDFEKDPGAGTGHIAFFDASLIAFKAPELAPTRISAAEAPMSTEAAYAQLQAMGLKPIGGAPDAFEAAAAGGRHAGFLTNYLGRSPEELQAGIDSFDRQIALHQAKIADPASAIDDWASLDPRAQAGLLNKWASDIARQQEQQFILRALLGGRTP